VAEGHTVSNGTFCWMVCNGEYQKLHKHPCVRLALNTSSIFLSDKKLHYNYLISTAHSTEYIRSIGIPELLEKLIE
jgi:expansin (peptidoglycan-binding protein)